MTTTQHTFIGNLTADPELRFTSSGHAVASFTVADSKRVYDKDASEWKDADPVFIRCQMWRQYAENVAESLQKGMRVIVVGTLKQRTWETREGEKRTTIELDADDVGPALKFATAKVTRTTRNGGSPAASGAMEDPWAHQPASAASPSYDEPPF